MKPALYIVVVVIVVVLAAGLMYLRSLGKVQTATTNDSADSFYDLKTRTLEGEVFELSAYRGKVALVVNLASKCGLTPQYEGLEDLYRELEPHGFVIFGFPSNDFLNQEPGTPAEIRQFCSATYDVTFPLFEKMTVKGDGKSEIYRRLTAELDEPDWNFTKYLVDRDGQVMNRFGPRVKPGDENMRVKIDELLGR